MKTAFPKNKPSGWSFLLLSLLTFAGSIIYNFWPADDEIKLEPVNSPSVVDLPTEKPTVSVKSQLSPSKDSPVEKQATPSPQNMQNAAKALPPEAEAAQESLKEFNDKRDLYDKACLRIQNEFDDPEDEEALEEDRGANNNTDGQPAWPSRKPRQFERSFDDIAKEREFCRSAAQDLFDTFASAEERCQSAGHDTEAQNFLNAPQDTLKHACILAGTFKDQVFGNLVREHIILVKEASARFIEDNSLSEDQKNTNIFLCQKITGYADLMQSYLAHNYKDNVPFSWILWIDETVLTVPTCKTFLSPKP